MNTKIKISSLLVNSVQVIQSDCTLTERSRPLPLSSSSTDGYVALPNIMISRVTLIKHLGAHPWALIPEHMRVREGRGRATVNLWEPKQWHAAWIHVHWKISKNLVRPISFMIPVLQKLVKNSQKTCMVIGGESLYYHPLCLKTIRCPLLTFKQVVLAVNIPPLRSDCEEIFS